MKKTLVTLVLAVAAISSSYAQGWVLFNDTTTTKISTNSVTTATAGTATQLTFAAGASTSYYYALFSSTSTQLIGGVTNAVIGANGTYAFNDGNWYFNNPGFGPDYGTNTLTAGRFNTTVSDPANSQGTQVTSGASQSFVVIGWSSNIGNTVAALMNWYNTAGHFGIDGWVGESSTSAFMAPGTGGVNPVPGLFGAGGGLIQGFTLGAVIAPEPSTIALAGLGGLSLLLFRRRK